MGMQTEYAFTLPRGYADSSGNIHKQGTMRLATAMDEIAPLRDLRVKSNQAYLAVVLLAQVITKLGTLNSVDTGSSRTSSPLISPICRIFIAG